MHNIHTRFLNEYHPSQSLEAAIHSQALSVGNKEIRNKLRRDAAEFSAAIEGKLAEFAQRYGNVDLRGSLYEGEGLPPTGITAQQMLWNEVARLLFERGGEWRPYTQVDAQGVVSAPLPERMTVFEWYFAYDVVKAVGEALSEIFLSIGRDGAFDAEHYHWLRS
jgi:hypothetical protein